MNGAHECPDDNSADKILSLKNDVHLPMKNSNWNRKDNGRVSRRERRRERDVLRMFQPAVPVNGRPSFLRELSARAAFLWTVGSPEIYPAKRNYSSKRSAR